LIKTFYSPSGDWFAVDTTPPLKIHKKKFQNTKTSDYMFVNQKEFQMNKKIQKKLHLNKITIQSFANKLDSAEQQEVKGGSITVGPYSTVTPVFCKP
jgi:hypothetical protein